MLFKGYPAGRKSTNLAPIFFLLPGFAPCALVWLFWIDRTIEILLAKIVKCIGLFTYALIPDLGAANALSSPIADPSRARGIDRWNNLRSQDRKLQRYGSAAVFSGAVGSDSN
jgi:hypothetical protein